MIKLRTTIKQTANQILHFTETPTELLSFSFSPSLSLSLSLPLCLSISCRYGLVGSVRQAGIMNRASSAAILIPALAPCAWLPLGLILPGSQLFPCKHRSIFLVCLSPHFPPQYTAAYYQDQVSSHGKKWHLLLRLRLRKMCCLTE